MLLQNVNDNLNIDKILPFTINDANQRGKIVRLGLSLNQIIDKHQYPSFISEFLAELMVLVALMGDSLKSDGMITAQIQSDGILKLVIADYFEGGKIRGYVRMDEEKLAGLAGKRPSFNELTGKGILSITIDFGAIEDNYQGIVELKGENLSACLEEYFRQSEQINTSFKISVGKPLAGADFWIGGGIMVQELPNTQNSEKTIENWNRTESFVKTVKDSEILDPKLALDQLLYRLFHEDGVWVYNAKSIEHGCKCSRAKAENSIKSLTHEELEEIRAESGSQDIVVTCQFCSKKEVF